MSRDRRKGAAGGPPPGAGRFIEPMRAALAASLPEGPAWRHLRHSRFAGLRDDKDPHEVVREAS